MAYKQFCWRTARKFYSTNKHLRNSKAVELSRTRNIGIIAHIDAGKTTVTERLLYLAGTTKSMGDVDSGNTVTDYLDIERERGITVQSASVAFNWNNHKINLIDTPGHVDFTVEVERCVRVLDGVVTILDSNAGVQAQTLTVWKQASKFNLPSIFFVNKVDKKNCNFTSAVDSIEQRLGMKALITMEPMEPKGHVSSIIDVLRGNVLTLDKTAKWKKIEKSTAEWDKFCRAKEDLLYGIADLDEDFMSLFLDKNGGKFDSIAQEDILCALRKLSFSRKGVVVSGGSALRSPQSVLPLLDNIIAFLPSPEEQVEQLRSVFQDEFSALVFKILHDKRKGQLSYARVYTGELKNNTSVYNPNREVSEGPLRLFEPQSDELISKDTIRTGDIIVISGLKHTKTGDTLLLSESTSKRALENLNSSSINQQYSVCKEGSQALFSGIDFPEPVYFCCIEPPTTASIHEFEKALLELSVDDPSLKVRKESDTGQTVIETMGELHLEVIKDKFKRFYDLEVFLGPLQIAYRESIQSSLEHTACVEDVQGEKERNHTASITLLVKPTPNQGGFKNITLDLPPGTRHPRPEWLKAIKEGCSNALHNGPILGFAVQDVSVSLRELTASGGKVNPAIISACAHKCVTEALSLAGAYLVEPVIRTEITLEGGEGMQNLLQDLSRRRAQIEKCEGVSGSQSLIVASLPLAEMQGLSSVVRISTSGMGSLSVQVAGYSTVSEQEQSAIVAKLTGKW